MRPLRTAILPCSKRMANRKPACRRCPQWWCRTPPQRRGCLRSDCAGRGPLRDRALAAHPALCAQKTRVKVRAGAVCAVFSPPSARYRQGMTPEYMLSADGGPFEDQDAAAMMRDILARKLGEAFGVMEHPTGGWAVVRGADPSPQAAREATHPTDPVPIAGSVDGAIPEGPGDVLARSRSAGRARPEGHRNTEPAAPPPTSAAPLSAAAYPPRFALGVSPQAFAHHLLLMAVGSLLVVMPSAIPLPAGARDDPAVNAFLMECGQLGGLLLALWSLWKFLSAYLFYNYEGTEHHVSARKRGRSRVKRPRCTSRTCSLVASSALCGNASGAWARRARRDHSRQGTLAVAGAAARASAQQRRQRGAGEQERAHDVGTTRSRSPLRTQFWMPACLKPGGLVDFNHQ